MGKNHYLTKFESEMTYGNKNSVIGSLHRQNLKITYALTKIKVKVTATKNRNNGFQSITESGMISGNELWYVVILYGPKFENA